MEHTQLPINNCPMLKEGLCRLSLTEENPDFQALKKINKLKAENTKLKEALEKIIINEARVMKELGEMFGGKRWLSKSGTALIATQALKGNQ